MPSGFTAKANNQKHTMVSPALAAASVHQKPSLANILGNTKNMGSVGITYQKVYQA